MQLPSIVWAKSNRYVRAAARIDSGVSMDTGNGYINVDLEFPHQTHIKMKEHEVHIGVTLSPPIGVMTQIKPSRQMSPNMNYRKAERRRIRLARCAAISTSN